MQKEKRIPLTAKQRVIYKKMKELNGSFLKPHRKPTGLDVFRLMDKDLNPVANFREDVVYRLANKNYLKRDGYKFILNDGF